MVTFRNNNGRRNNFRRGDRNFKSNADRNKFASSFSNSENFQRKSPGRNNHNAPKYWKIQQFGKRSLSSGDKILSENYFQHADHFTRILNEKEIYKRSINNKDDVDSNNSIAKRKNEISSEKNETNSDEHHSDSN